jgi:hypothetical protein
MSELTDFIKNFQFNKIKELNLNKRESINENQIENQIENIDKILKDKFSIIKEKSKFNEISILGNLTENIQISDIEIDNGFLSIICIMTIEKLIKNSKISINDINIKEILEKSHQAMFLNAVLRYTKGSRLYIICELISKNYDYNIKCGEGSDMILSIKDKSTHEEMKSNLIFHRSLGCKMFMTNFNEKPSCIFFKNDTYYFIDPGNVYINIKDKIFYYKGTELNEIINFIIKFMSEEMGNEDSIYVKIYPLYYNE